MNKKILMAALILILSFAFLGGCSAQNDAPTEICTVSVYCNTLLDHLDELAPEVLELVPENGVILTETEVAFHAGDTAFDVTKRALQEAKKHFEANVSSLGTVYMEGIGNIYAFDCSAMSGWLYKVNDEFLGMSAAACPVKAGDHVSWVYTCDLGYDVGGGGVDQSGE